MVLRGRVSGMGFAILAACAVTALWAVTAAFAASYLRNAEELLDTLRLAAWLLLMVGLVGVSDSRRQMSMPVLLAAAFCAIVIGYEALVLVLDASLASAIARAHDLM